MFHAGFVQCRSRTFYFQLSATVVQAVHRAILLKKLFDYSQNSFLHSAIFQIYLPIEIATTYHILLPAAKTTVTTPSTETFQSRGT